MTFTQAAETHLDDVYGYLTWFTGDRAAADDLTGETFERALRLWHRFDPARGSARTWLCQVARTVALDHFRSERRLAPPEVRERVRLIAVADATPPRRVFSWRRALVVLVPVAAAVAAAVVFTQPAHHPQQLAGKALERAATPGRPTTVRTAVAEGAATRLAPPAPSTHRIQRYGASLELHVATGLDVSNGVKAALRIAASYSGYPVSVHESAQPGNAYADLVLKIPRSHVQQAVARLSLLGTIVGEHVDIQDLQSGINATDRTIASLQKQLAALRAQPQTDTAKRQIAALTARIVALQRNRATTVRGAHFASVSLSLTTQVATRREHHGHGPLHGLGVAFRWIGIGAVYALALGGPVLLLGLLVWLAARALRRRREDALLSRP